MQESSREFNVNHADIALSHSRRKKTMIIVDSMDPVVSSIAKMILKSRQSLKLLGLR